MCHNPYFNRWFSAIGGYMKVKIIVYQVTILILIDGFLQYKDCSQWEHMGSKVTIIILIDGFLQ